MGQKPKQGDRPRNASHETSGGGGLKSKAKGKAIGAEKMENNNIKTELWKTYTKKAYTHNYIVGFNFLGTIWAIELEPLELFPLLRVTPSSRGEGYALRFRPSTSEKYKLYHRAYKVATAEEFEKRFKAVKYNRGEVFEMYLNEAAGKEWKKDAVPFTDGPDLEVDGKPYQLKFEGGTFLTEKRAEELEK